MHGLPIFNSLVQDAADHTLSPCLGYGLLFGHIFCHVADYFSKIESKSEIHVGAPDFHDWDAVTVQPAIVSGRNDFKRRFLVFVGSFPHGCLLDGHTGPIRDIVRETETAKDDLLLLSLAVELAKVPLNSTIQVTLTGPPGFRRVAEYIQ